MHTKINMCNRVLAVRASGSARRSGACSFRAVAALVRRRCVRKLASAPGATAPPAGTERATPCRCGHSPPALRHTSEGRWSPRRARALRPKARSQPSTLNLIYHIIQRLRKAALLYTTDWPIKINSLRGQMHVTSNNLVT